MATIREQLSTLRKQIKIPYRVEFVNRVVEPVEFVDKVVYIHLWLKEKKDELVQ